MIYTVLTPSQTMNPTVSAAATTLNTGSGSTHTMRYTAQVHTSIRVVRVLLGSRASAIGQALEFTAERLVSWLAGHVPVRRGRVRERHVAEPLLGEDYRT